MDLSTAHPLHQIVLHKVSIHIERSGDGGNAGYRCGIREVGGSSGKSQEVHAGRKLDFLDSIRSGEGVVLIRVECNIPAV